MVGNNNVFKGRNKAGFIYLLLTQKFGFEPMAQIGFERFLTMKHLAQKFDSLPSFRKFRFHFQDIIFLLPFLWLVTKFTLKLVTKLVTKCPSMSEFVNLASSPRTRRLNLNLLVSGFLY
jgi:hypothetical protein